MDAKDASLLDALLDSWDRNNTILVNLLRALPEGGLGTRVMKGGRSVAELFTHIHYVRLAFVSEDAPEFATDLPDEYVDERDTARCPDSCASALHGGAPHRTRFRRRCGNQRCASGTDRR